MFGRILSSYDLSISVVLLIMLPFSSLMLFEKTVIFVDILGGGKRERRLHAFVIPGLLQLRLWIINLIFTVTLLQNRDNAT